MQNLDRDIRGKTTDDKIMRFAVSVLFLAASFSFSNRLHAQTDDRDTSRAPASFDGIGGLDNDLNGQFILSPPERAPASVNHAKSSSTARRSRLPASVADGFELRVQYGNETSMFWVVKREGRHDLIYANSGGSKSSLSLSPEIFDRLQTVAMSFKGKESDIKRCKDASMQLSVVATGHAEKTTTACVTAKDAETERLKNFGQSLAAVAR